MKEYATSNIRNIVLASHSGSGKTMLADSLLFFTGALTRLGEINAGSTSSDFQDEEKRRGISISTSVIPIEYQNHKINLRDNPCRVRINKLRNSSLSKVLLQYL